MISSILVTCDLIPLAVLKRPKPCAATSRSAQVTCDLIPLAVLKPLMVGAAEIAVGVTCDLIPLAVLKLLVEDEALPIHNTSHM